MLVLKSLLIRCPAWLFLLAWCLLASIPWDDVRGGEQATPPPAADQDLSGQLRRAIATGDLQKLQSVLAAGADATEIDPDTGLTPIQIASLRGYAQIVALLERDGAKLTPLPPLGPLLDAQLSKKVAGEVPAVAVLVSRNGEIIHQGGYGYANLSHLVKATPHTKFRIGSVTKQFTAAAILRLQEQGQLSVNDTLSKYMKDFPRGDQVTIHHLLTHTSGIHSYTSRPDFYVNVTRKVTPEELIKTIRSDEYDFDPGKGWKYNNSGYFLLGEIVARVAGKPFGEFLQEEFFGPLEMADTGIHEPTAILSHEAIGYAVQEDQLVQSLNWNMGWAGGAGALYSTVIDLHRWNEALFNGDVLSEASRKQAWQVYPVEDVDKAVPYGYGWVVGELRGVRRIHHDGGLNGFVSSLNRFPQYDVTIVVLVNSTPHPDGIAPGELVQAIGEALLHEHMEPREVRQAMAEVDRSQWDAIVGRYDYGGAVLSVSRRDDQLFAQLTGQSEFEIFPESATRFFWKVVDAQVEFVVDENGRVTKALHAQGGTKITAARLPDQAAIQLTPEELDAFVGKYQYGPAVLTVTRTDNRLFAQLTGQPQFEIFPKSKDAFFWRVVEAEVKFHHEDGRVTKAIHTQAGQTLEAPRLD